MPLGTGESVEFDVQSYVAITNHLAEAVASLCRSENENRERCRPHERDIVGKGQDIKHALMLRILSSVRHR